MKKQRILSLFLALCMLLSEIPSVSAAGISADNTKRPLSFEKVSDVEVEVEPELPKLEKADTEEYAASDEVRVSILLEKQATLEIYSSDDVADNSNAMAYRKKLQQEQAEMVSDIEELALKGNSLDVVWNLTLAANIISANVRYDQIEAIEAVDGVVQVVIETAYNPLELESAEPFMSSSSGMTGADTAWAAGYTGAGGRIAILDTGLDTDHQSFDGDAYLYSLQQLAEAKSMPYEEYVASLNLLDTEEVETVLEQLNIYPYVQYLPGTSGKAYYVNEKVPFALNYVDRDYDVTHDNDNKGGHGSHVAGIAAANRYIPDEDGYQNALESVLTQGVAPDAQLIVMKVFGKNGGAYESDYMVAIEDAIMLKCDAVNLSLGAAKGFARSQVYQTILDNLTDSNAIVTIAAGNDGVWSGYSANGVGYLYADDVDFSNVALPSVATNSMAVASADNTGSTNYYISVGNNIIFYNNGSSNGEYLKGLNAMPQGDYDYLFLEGVGTEEEINEAAEYYTRAGGNVTKTILVCARGQISFATKANNAAKAGFAASIIYNNTTGTIGMDLSEYTGVGPCVAITKEDGAIMQAKAEAVEKNGKVLYYHGSVYVSNKLTVITSDDNPQMSEFSSWGIPGSLEMKPEITAPGGNIYSVDGTVSSGDAYMNNSGTSMAAPQVAGMTAVLMQYIKENNLTAKTGLTSRQLATSLLMATAEPMTDDSTSSYYSILQQGAGLADLSKAMQASSYIRMADSATSGAADGKVKVELGDDPERNGVYSFRFAIHNFSDSAKTYCLNSDFFTQGLFQKEEQGYLDMATTTLPADVVYTVENKKLTISSKFACDLNGDGLTDAKDAQIILEYAAGNDMREYLSAINAKADLNEDGSVSTYDAHLLLESLSSEFFQVKAGEALDVTVTVSLTDKEGLNQNYVNGAYVEGFVYVESAPDAEGVIDPEYSIPVLGFYGNWSDASMYDRANYEEVVYEEALVPYTGYYNYLSLWPDGGLVERNFIGNPYLVEESYPAGKEAIKTKTEFGDMAVSLIRNAGGFLFYVLDGENNFAVARDAEQLHAAYYYEAGGAWYLAQSVGLSIWESPKDWGFEEGDKLTIGFMSLPEYYENGDALSKEELKELMFSGEIGEGAFHSYTFTVDDTAPEILGLTVAENGDLIVKAKDENYIAAIAVLDGKGGTVLKMSAVEQEEANTIVETRIDMSQIMNKIDKNCMVMVADYAGNENVYKVTDYNEGIDYTGHMYGFSSTGNRGTANSWMDIDAEELYRYEGSETGNTEWGGTVDVANMPWTVLAAEYVNGYVYMATQDGALYVAPQGDWENATLIKQDSIYASVKEFAYNTKDGKLYALYWEEESKQNVVATVSPANGELTTCYTVSIQAPEEVYFSDYSYQLMALAIDDEGNFYAINNSRSNWKTAFLYAWTNADAADGVITELTPVNNTKDGYAGEYAYSSDGQTGMSGSNKTCRQSLAWDHDKDMLYWASAMSNVSANNILYRFDVETGKATKATPNMENVGYEVGTFVDNVYALYIVPAESGEMEFVKEPTGLDIEQETLSLFVGADYSLTVHVSPWTLEDKSLTWTSEDTNIASVDENGVVTAKACGTTVIKAVTNAKPEQQDTVTVTVKEIPNLKLRGLLYDAEGNESWVAFETLQAEDWSILHGNVTYDFVAGALLEDTLYVHDGAHMYGVDANTYEVTDYGELDASWLWSDAAAAPENELGYFNRIVGVISNGLSFAVMDVTTGIGTDLPYYNEFRNDPAAVIAYKGSTTYMDKYGTYPAYEYYVMTELGTLYLLTTYAFYDTDAGFVQYDCDLEQIGETGLRLRGASNVEKTGDASMYYDEANEMLVVSYSDGKTTRLYVFEPEYCAPVEIGTFGEDIWPVTTLYQYESFAETTVRVSPKNATMYTGDKVQLTAKVYLADSDNVIWTSSDESIATVDENGLVTAKKEGTVTITVKSIKGGKEDTAVITVNGLSTIDAKLHAYLTTPDGNSWVSIDAGSLTVSKLQAGDKDFTGALVVDGKIIATDKTHYYQIDPENEYVVAMGDMFTDGDGASYLYMLDGTAAPITERLIPDLQTGENALVQVGGTPIYISGFDGSSTYYLVLLQDYATGQYDAIGLDKEYKPAAIAYQQSELINNYWWDYYYILSYDGLLERFYVQNAVVDGEEIPASGDWKKDTVDTGLRFEDGEAMSMEYVETDSFTGLIISCAGEDGVELYCYDTVNKKAGKLGTIDGATDLVGLSLMEAAVGETKTITFKVVNGTWADGTTADIVKTIKLDDDGIGTVEVPEGMIANAGFEGGSWNKTPSYYVEGTEPETYTYTFKQKQTGGGGDADLTGKLLAWAYDVEGSKWVEIDATRKAYRTLKADYNYYTGAGVSDGKIYAGMNKAYYIIDPANDYAVTQGAAIGNEGEMQDGTGVPAKTVTLNGKEVNVGGYFLNIAYVASWGGYWSAQAVTDVTSTTGYTDVYDESYLLDYLKVCAVAYLKGEITDDGTAYEETFLLLTKDGTLYTFTLTTTEEGLNNTGVLTEVENLTDLAVSYCATMTGVSEDTVVIGITNDNTILYSYCLGSGKAEVLYDMQDVWELHGLALMDDITTGEKETQSIEGAQNAQEMQSTQEVQGSLQSVVLNNDTVSVEPATVTVKLTEDANVTNGLLEISFDSEMMQYLGTSSMNVQYAINDSKAEEGKLIVAYASGTPVVAGDLIAALRFNTLKDGQTSVTVNTKESNENIGLNENNRITIQIPKKDEQPKDDKADNSDTSTLPADKNTAAGNPKTGDDSRVVLWIGFMAVCAVAIAALLVYRKKKNS